MQYIAGFFIILSVLSGTAALWQTLQVQRAENEIQRITTELSAERANVAQLEDEIDLIGVQVGQFQEKIAQIEAERLSARRQVEYTRTLFNDHDLAKLMAAKPGLITNRMQKASDAVLTDLQSVTE